MAQAKKTNRKEEPAGGKQIRCSEALHKRAKLYSVQQGIELMAVADAALDEYLKKRGA